MKEQNWAPTSSFFDPTPLALGKARSLRKRSSVGKAKCKTGTAAATEIQEASSSSQDSQMEESRNTAPDDSQGSSVSDVSMTDDATSTPLGSLTICDEQTEEPMSIDVAVDSDAPRNVQPPAVRKSSLAYILGP